MTNITGGEDPWNAGLKVKWVAFRFPTLRPFSIFEQILAGKNEPDTVSLNNICYQI
jgi:hypothetical protein